MDEFIQQVVRWVDEKPGQAQAWFTLLGAFVAGVLALVGWIALSSLRAVKEWRSAQIKIQTIRSLDDTKLEGMIQIYEDQFLEDERFSASEIEQWLKWKGRRERYKYRIITIVKREEVAGFCISMKCNKARANFVAYLAIKDGALTPHETRQAVGRMINRTEPFWGRSKYVVFEVADPTESHINAVERNRRIARMRRLCSFGRQGGWCCGYVAIQYRQPQYISDSSYVDRRPMLLGIMTRGECIDTINLEDLVYILTFIYLRIYVSCLPDGSDREAFISEMDREIDAIRSACPESVVVTDLLAMWGQHCIKCGA